jgi:uncharacterized protein (DUF1800 family)
MRTSYILAAATLTAFTLSQHLDAAEAQVESIQIISNKLQVVVRPEDEAGILRILTSTSPGGPWVTNATTSTPGTNSTLVGTTWTSNAPPGNFFFVRAEIEVYPSEKQLAAHVLNRLAYGPTPYEMARILGLKTNNPGANQTIEYGEGVIDGGIGVDAWINEQLNPALITEDVTNQFNRPLNIMGQNLEDIYDRFGDIQTVVLTNKTVFVTPVTNEMTMEVTLVTNTIPPEVDGPGTLSFHDFRAFYAAHAVGSRRQLYQVLLHWLENHFVSQWTKARETFQGQYNQVGGDIQNRIPTKMEAEEHKAYRAAMLNPLVTFRDLLRLQHQSTSMTVYLDTNDSAANGSNIANENYAREIMELYTMGVDNGYDQGDIVALSPAWAGWDVRKVAIANAFNLYAHQEGALSPAQNSNNFGVFVLQFRRTSHTTQPLFVWYHRDPNVPQIAPNYPNGSVLTPKTVPGRFNGSSMTPSFNYTSINYGTNTVAGRYGLRLPATDITLNSQRAAMTNKVYTVMDMLADLPFTQEYISVKLCQLLVHDNFHHGYDFSDSQVTPEEQLVWNCMMTWQTNATKGQIYKIVKTITDSELFRSKASFRHKIKTPLEFTMSAVRALRLSTNGTFNANSFSADTDGYSIVSGTNSTSTAHPMVRMGEYRIFDRAEPDGYPETGTIYVGASGISERVRWIHSILPRRDADGSTTDDGIQGRNYTFIDPVSFMQQHLGTGLHKDADAVARFFISRIYPGESPANMDEYRRIAINALNTADNGTANLFSSLGAITTNTYQDRVRRMVAILMSMPRFNEQ